MNRIALLPAAALAFLSTPALAAPPTAAERTMIATVDAEQARTLALLETAVNQNSGTRNLAGVRAVHDMLAPEFAALGFAVRWVPQDAVGRAGHLIATRKGKPGRKRLLLIGHLDTVFEPDSGFLKFERVDADHARGPGVADDKGGVVTMIAALRAMHTAGTLKNANIELVLTGDEEEEASRSTPLAPIWSPQAAAPMPRSTSRAWRAMAGATWARWRGARRATGR